MKKLLVLLLTVFFACYSSASFAKNELKVAIFLEPPFANLVQGKLVGEFIDVAKLLAKSANLNVTFVQCPFARCLALVKSGSADMVFGLLKLPEREQDLLFIEPPYFEQTSPLKFYTLNKHNYVINEFSDLKGLTVGTLRGSAYFEQFDTDIDIKKIELTSREQMVNMLLKDRIDTFLEREESVLPLVSTQDYQQFSIAKYAYNKTVKSYIAISKNSPIKQYAATFSATLAKAIDEGVIAKIIAKRDSYEKSTINRKH